MSDLGRRLNGLERLWPKPARREWDQAALERAVARIAAERGMTVEALLAETERIVGPQGTGDGITTMREAVERIAAERGLDAEEVFAEAERVIAEYGWHFQAEGPP